MTTIFERAQRYLERCPPAISGQQGHNTTFRIACALMHGFALTEAEALSVLQPWNARCQPPWSESELRHKVTSAAHAPPKRPRGWLAMLVQLPLRIAAIYTSGGNSIHALVRVDAANKAHWDAIAKQMERMLTVLGADWKTVTAVRLTRLPGCYRGEEGPPRPRSMPARDGWRTEPLEFDERGDPIWTPKTQPELPPASLWQGGKLQELLYLDPEPDGKPIRLKPTRQEIYEAWLTEVRAQKEEDKP